VLLKEGYRAWASVLQLFKGFCQLDSPGPLAGYDRAPILLRIDWGNAANVSPASC
jgi:hypothetical protein